MLNRSTPHVHIAGNRLYCIFQMLHSKVFLANRVEFHCTIRTIFCVLLPFSHIFLPVLCSLKLTDSHKGHRVVRWKQSPSVPRSSPASSLVFMLLSSHMHVINTTAACWEDTCDMSVLDFPPSVFMCHNCFCSSTHNTSRCYKKDTYPILQHICCIKRPNAALF